MLALVYGILAPVFFTVKAYSIRRYPNYRAIDLGIDSLIFEYLCYVCMYGAYLGLEVGPFDLSDFAYGQLIGVLFLIGKFTLTLAYAEGLGGPVNTLSVVQSIVQTVLDVLIG